MPAVKNDTIIQSIEKKAAIAEELASLEAALNDLAQRRSELVQLSQAVAQTTDVFNGIALSEFDGHITTVDFSIPRSALVFEHAGKPGTFRVQTRVRYNGDSLLPRDFSSEAEAVLAAKTWVTSA